jgi:hypothetical protein
VPSGVAPSSSPGRPSGPKAAEAFLTAVDTRRLAWCLGCAVALVGVLGLVHASAPGDSVWRLSRFGLDEEWSLPALWSGALLAGAALASVVAGHAGGLPTVRPRVLEALGALFAFMALDEVVQIHERIEAAVDVGWQRLYLPLVPLGGLLWVLVLRGLAARSRSAALLFCAGGLAWFVAELFEREQRDGAVLRHRWTIFPEEMLEMTGSALFLLALVLGIQAVPRAAYPPLSARRRWGRARR